MSKKLILPGLVLGIFLVGLFAVGSYDPRHELGVFTPDVVEANLSLPGLTVPDLTTPDLTTPDLTTPDLTTPELDTPEVTVPDVTAPTTDTPNVNVSYCHIYASANTIAYGTDVTITWETEGFSTFTLNGQTVSGPDGGKTFYNVQANTSFKLVATSADGNSKCTATVFVTCLPPALTPTCTLLPASQSVNEGGKATLTWTTTNADSVSITEFGGVALNGTKQTAPLYADKTYTLTAIGEGGEVQCVAVVDVIPDIPVPTCTLTPASQTIAEGEKATLTWTTTNANSVSITEFGGVALNGTEQTAPLYADKTYTLTASDSNGRQVQCVAVVDVVPEVPAPSCDTFTAVPSTINKGESSLLSWTTTNATKVVINNGIGEVAADDSISVSPLETTTYTLTVFDDYYATDSCVTTITITPTNQVPQCLYLTADKTTLPAGGGNITLSWDTVRANSVSISPTVGVVGDQGTTTVHVTSDTLFTLTARDLDGDTDTCTLPIDVETVEPTPISCAQNVSFTASNYSIDEGDSTTLNWDTTGITSLSISNINSTALDGSAVVSPSSDITYTLTATDGETTISCPLSINVDRDTGGGGGGGGTPHPRCELDISDDHIRRGEEITIEWDTSNAGDVTLVDNHGETIFTTEDFLSKDKDEFFDGELTLRPDRDTTYTLLVERGSRDEECEVDVEVDDSVTVLQVRDQQPLVAGISLSQTPYTGFEAGPILTTLFYVLLVGWALFVAYVLVIKRDSIAGFSLATADATVAVTPTPREINPDLFANHDVPAPRAPIAAATATVPSNLPTGTPQIGFQTAPVAPVVTSVPVEENALSEIENLAHTHRVLLSSDAIAIFATTFSDTDEQTAHMEEIITMAKETIPSEDGWVVINKSRMETLVASVAATVAQKQPVVASVTIPNGSSSLAEAIVTGNVAAAYQMIGNRPMFSLADAAADLDAAYRARTGASVTISDMLASETIRLSDEQIKNAINALTGALDGVYSSEEEAVKMAILKAVKAVA